MDNPSQDPVPSFPFSGHGELAIVLEKTEPSMRGYYMRISTDKNEITVDMDTPGSTTNRRITARGTLSTSPTLKANLEATSPFGAFSAETETILDNNVKSVSLRINRNRKNYFAKVQLNSAPQGDVMLYTSTVEMEHPAQPRAVIFQGKFSHHAGRSLTVSMKPSGPFANVPVQFEATLSRQMTSRAMKLSLSDCDIVTPFGRVAINSAEINRETDNSRVVVDMTYGAEQHAVNFDGRIEKLGDLMKSSLNYRSSRFPATNLGLSFVRKNTANVIDNEFVMTHGPDSEKAVNRLAIKQTTNNPKDLDFRRFDNKFEGNTEVMFNLI